MLKDNFVCGFRDIGNQKYAGASGKHMPDENAVDTTNGAGPHNIQLFVLDPDGTVLTCLPGYWHAEDLAPELALAQELDQVWHDPNLTLSEKRAKYSQMQLAHIAAHPQAEHKRSHMQGFDEKYEAKTNPNSDFFYNPRAIDPATGQTPASNVKSIDIVMHERLAMRPFVPYDKFDVAQYSSYGKLKYDKQEMFRDSSGKIAEGANIGDEPMIGNDPKAHPIKTGVKRTGMRVARQSVYTLVRSLIH
ncbi:MAG: hypothetical protein JSS86_05975 [Cyanobacteria bacterium SZAS LIN-2]|nr:hypothetical protein [Cyanobacteria bacterium SZAS LIN-2]